MHRLYLIILIGLFSCNNDNAISLSDLRFPNPEGDFIRDNQIDTTFIFIPQENGGELITYLTYDENGNILVDSTDFGVKVLNNYNSRGFLIKRELRGNRYDRIDSVLYDFDPDSVILTQKWIEKNVYFRFYFDKNGRLNQRLEIDNSENPRILTRKTTYMYEGELLRQSLIYTNSKKIAEIEYDYYYSKNGILDSITLKTNNGHRQRWIYDSLGLLSEDWSNNYKSDERFVHKKRQ